MGGRGASSGVKGLSDNFQQKVSLAKRGKPEELIKELSKLKFISEKEEKAYGTLVTKFKSAVYKNGNDEIQVRFDSNYTSKEINNSAKDKLYTVVSVYQKKNGNPYSLTYLYNKETTSLKNIKNNYDKGMELYKKITKGK